MKQIYVIGGAVIDIFLHPYHRMVLHDSNPGYVHESLGGVARNIAENLARLGFQCTLLTALGNDTYGTLIRQSAAAIGLTLDVITTERTPAYYSVIDENQDDLIGVAVMDQLSSIDSNILLSRKIDIQKADLVIMDTNLSESAMETVLNLAKAPVVVDAISTQKAMKIRSMLPRIWGLKVNQLEAETLSGYRIKTPEDLIKVGAFFQEKGLQHTWITLGKEGAYHFQQTTWDYQKGRTVQVINPTGAGDAFLSGAIFAYFHGLPILHTATTNAGLNLQCEEAVCQRLTKSILLNAMKEDFL